MTPITENTPCWLFLHDHERSTPVGRSKEQTCPHGGVGSSVLDTNPSGVGGGGGPGRGRESKICLHFGGSFEFPISF